MAEQNKQFAMLFKKYRLRSEISTISEFADLMAEKGFHYESSLFTHWQSGDRTPRDRNIIIAMIEIFANNAGMKSKDEANELLMALNMRDLNTQELKEVFGDSEKDSRVKNSKGDVSIAKAIKKVFANLLKTQFVYLILLLFVIQTAWFIRIQIIHTYDTTEAYFFNWGYGFIALAGGVYGFLKSKKSNSISVKLFSLGLFSEWFGVQLWFYYNLKGINIPFPSLADIGYVGIIPIYLLGSISLLNLSWFKLDRRMMFIITPILAVISCYSLFLQISGLSFVSQMKYLLEFIHPIGELIPILIIMYILAFNKVNNYQRVQYSVVLFALLSQFVTDYAFMYTDQANTYVNAGFVDYLYVISYVLMSLAVAAITQPILNK